MESLVKTKYRENRGSVSQINGRRNVSIDMNGAALKSVDSFKYLGSYLSADSSLDKEIENRVARASASFGRFRSRVFLNRSLKLSTRVKVYNVICLSSLLYGAETWTIYRCHVKIT